MSGVRTDTSPDVRRRVRASTRVAEALMTAGRGPEAEQIRTLLGSGSPRRLLDVGGRTGAFTTRFVRPDDHVTVLEPDERIVRAAGPRRPNFRFVAGLGEQIPFPDRSFDCVTAVRSTHHMEAPERFFREAHRVLAEDGCLVIEELARGSRLARLFARLGRYQHHSHAMDFRSPADWVQGLSAAGFVDVRATEPGHWFFVSATKRDDPSTDLPSVPRASSPV